MNIFELTDKYTASTYGRYKLALKSGKGSLLYDENGNEYIDFGSGIAVNSFGISDSEWLEAITAQLGMINHASNYYYTEPQAKLAEMLCEKSGMKNVFFTNSGAEANECAIKCARKYAHDKYGDSRSTVITLENSFHGRTLTTLSATGQPAMHVNFAPFTPGFKHIPANDISALSADIGEDTAAIMLELVQGEGGVNRLTSDYVNAVVDICRERDILLIIDEVQTGNGRCGNLYAFMEYGISPDIVTTAKGLGGGLPIGAAMFGEKTSGVLTPGTHGSTFGGNPVCAAGACSIISRMTPELFEGVKKRAEYLKNRLENANGVKSVSGMGLMIGIETEKPAGDIVKRCMENGLLVLTAKTKVRLLPALNIPFELLEKGSDILLKAIAE